jgi:DeoR/GlpR family transcriptional regulator of sugar metabolism
MHTNVRLISTGTVLSNVTDIDLSPTDRAIFEMLREGRCTPAYIAEEHGYSRAHVRNRLQRLTEHNYVTRLHKGLYELDSDPEDTA